ncbi:hypothetical protein LBMAG56_54470 [Verrucomicrobiota bacterium]|nr:hypothetical protein LBMAG56_54470 [Verrucomicrobiota bacterium]
MLRFVATLAFAFAPVAHGAPDYLPRLGPSPLRLASPPPVPAVVAALPPLPPPPVEPDIPIQPPPPVTSTRVDSANPPVVIGPLEEFGPPAPPAVVARPNPSGARPDMSQMLLQFFANPGTNAAPNAIVTPVGFTPPVSATPASSRAVFERTP